MLWHGIRSVVAKKQPSAQESSILHILLMWFYSCSNSGADGQKCYRAVSPSCYNKNDQEV